MIVLDGRVFQRRAFDRWQIDPELPGCLDGITFGHASVLEWRLLAAALDEIEHQRRWVAEAEEVLAIFDRCHDLLPHDAQAPLGHSKAEAVESYLTSQDACSTDEIVVNLTARIIKGQSELLAMRDGQVGAASRARLAGKAEGLGVVRDWLRSL